MTDPVCLLGFDSARAARASRSAFQASLGRPTNLLVGAIFGKGGAEKVPVCCFLDCSVEFLDTVTATALVLAIRSGVQSR